MKIISSWKAYLSFILMTLGLIMGLCWLLFNQRMVYGRTEYGNWSFNYAALHGDSSEKIAATSALAVDATTGQVLYEKNANSRLPVASISKLLTVAVVIQEIKMGRLKWSTKVKITKPEAKLSRNTNYSNIPLTAGQSYTVYQLTEAALIKSSDASTIALARAGGDSMATFVKQMYAVAKMVGIHNAKLYNPVGLTNGEMGVFGFRRLSKAAENQMTATDVIRIARYLLKEDPQILAITKMTTVTIAGTKITNLNEMLPGEAAATSEVKVDGLKTGTSRKAGACFVSTGTYRGHRLITVILHAYDGNAGRFTQTANLYRYVAMNYEPVTFWPKLRVTVVNGRTNETNLTVLYPITLWRTSRRELTISYATINGKYGAKDRLIAPFKKNVVVGNLVYPKLMGLGGGRLAIPVATSSSVQRLTIFNRIIRWLKGYS